MKSIAIPCVAALAAEAARHEGPEARASSRSADQLRDEWRHMEQCRAYLSHRASAPVQPARHIDLFRGLVAHCMRSPHSTALLTFAMMMCTGIEVAAFSSLRPTDLAFRRLIETLRRDEETHHEISVEVLPIELHVRVTWGVKLATLGVLLRIAWITTTAWWPRVFGHYLREGVAVDDFGRILSDRVRLALDTMRLSFAVPAVRLYLKLMLAGFARDRTGAERQLLREG